MKKIPLIIGIAATVFMLLVYPDRCLKSAQYGLNLWFTTLLPSLFPFIVASFMLLETGVVRLIAHFFSPVTRFLFNTPGESAYIFFASALSGHPMGARLAAELYTRGHITESDAQGIVRFTSVSGPVFITGAICAGMLSAPETGLLLALSHYLAALLTGVIFGWFSRKQSAPRQKESLRDALARFDSDASKCPSIGALMAAGVEKAISTLLLVGGYVMLFSVVTEMLSVTGILDGIARLYSPIANLAGFTGQGVAALVYGSLEVTVGCAKAASMGADLPSKLVLIAYITSFSGLGVHMQTRAVCAAAKLKPKGFFIAKTLQGMISFALCMLLLYLFPVTVSTSALVFDTGIKNTAFGGVVFAAIAILAVIIIKIVRRRKTRSALLLSRKL